MRSEKGYIRPAAKGRMIGALLALVTLFSLRRASPLRGALILLLALLIPFTAHAACSNPAGSKGDLRFNGEIASLQYCDDESWQIVNGGNRTPAGGLIAHWTFGDGSGATALDNVGSNNGTLAGGASWTGGVLGGAVDLDGVDGLVNIGSAATIDDIFAGGGSISAWIYPYSWGESDFGRVFEKATGTQAANGYSLTLNNTGLNPNRNISFFRDFSGGYGSWITPVDSIALNSWQHVVVTFDEDSDTNDPKIYINGVEQSLNERATPSGTANSDAAAVLYIGNSAAADRSFEGQIDDVRIYDRVLSAGEVQQLYDLVAVGGASSDPCDPANAPSPGQVCDDGSIYAGDHPTTSEPLYVPPADNSSSVTWNNGTANPTVTGATSLTDGAANTVTLDGLSDAGSPHQAAKLCAGLSAYSHTDWYLPAKDELNVLYTNRVAIGGFDTSGSWPSGNYWSSSESNDGNAWFQVFDASGWQEISGDKTFSFPVRCARQGYVASVGCSNPSGQAGDIIYNGDSNVLQWCDGASWHAAGPVPGSGGAGCSNPAGGEGDIIYNDDYVVMQYCDGANWRKMGPNPVPTEGLIGHWGLNETSGTAAADSVGGNNGAMQGGLDAGNDSVAGMAGGALDFDGTDDTILVANDPSFENLGPLTVSAWVYPTAYPFDIAGTNRTGDGGWGFFAASTGEMHGFIDTDASGNGNYRLRSAQTVPLNQWTHVVWVFDGDITDETGSKIFYNGVETTYQAVDGSTGTIYDDTGFDLYLGYLALEGAGPLAGRLDDVRIYNRALSATEVKHLYLGTGGN